MKYEDLIKISDPYKVYIKFIETYPCDSEIKISTRKDKKYMIYNPDKGKWFHFGSTMEDYTKHQDQQRRINFLIRNQRWAEADMYSAAYASYNLLW
jgi:hypothetical protein